MNRWLATLLVLLGFFPATVQAQTIRTLIVGIDSYQFSANPNRNAAFKDLKGAVNDSFRFKKTLSSIYGLQLDGLSEDSASPENCKGESESSITLINFCANRDAIERALNQLIDRSKPNDTVLFYFAGHGSQYPADTRFDQASGFNGTILPSDARDPKGIAKGDILDWELKAIKDRATAAGIYFVTIFDSCNSGTATRSGGDSQSRSVPRLNVKPPARPDLPQPSGPGGGYWVHLAAAMDGEQAQEVSSGTIGKREGVFTTALIEALFATPQGTFGDLIREVRNRLARAGHISQTPVGEGRLAASLGNAARPAALFQTKQTDNGMILGVGRLSGMVEGSRFALFANEAEAVAANAVPKATAQLIEVAEFTGKLLPDPAAPGALSVEMIAVETERAPGDLKIGIANMVKNAEEKQQVQARLDAIAFVGPARGNGHAQIASHQKKKGEAQLLASDGTIIGNLGKIDDANFSDRLLAMLKKIVRVQQLLDLRTESDSKTAPIRFCIDDSEYAAPTDGCPPPEKREGRTLKRDAKAIVTVNNESEMPLYFYVFGIDPTFGVALILPQPGAMDTAIDPLRPYRNPDDPLVPLVRGTYRFVTIATDQPINAAALEQRGTSARSGSGCKSALERLLCDANKGKRDPTAPKVGNWKAIVETVIVE